MIFLLMISCVLSKTSITGVIDSSSQKSCTVELNTGDFILIESSVCGKSREGDKIIFYVRKE